MDSSTTPSNYSRYILFAIVAALIVVLWITSKKQESFSMMPIPAITEAPVALTPCLESGKCP